MYDIFLLSNNSQLLDTIKDQFPFAKCASNVDEAKSQSLTNMLWVINEHTNLSEILDIRLPEWECQYTHVMPTCRLVPKHLTNNREKQYATLYEPQYDIFFISYNEVAADENFKKISKRFPRVKRIHGITGIHQAHIEAAKQSESSHFWVVDADAIIAESFNFTINDIDKDTVYIWHSQNPINDLVYGYGGVKLLPKHSTLAVATDSIDMTTSISKKTCVIPTISNITAFNTDPFSTWRSAFRECVKLSSKVINDQLDEETDNRLTAWCSAIEDRPYSKYATMGAILGKQYGKQNADNMSALSKINDFEWLYNYFATSSAAIGNISEIT
jgi:hypothetical protein